MEGRKAGGWAGSLDPSGMNEVVLQTQASVSTHVTILFLHTYKMVRNVSLILQLSLLPKCCLFIYKDLNIKASRPFVPSALAGRAAWLRSLSSLRCNQPKKPLQLLLCPVVVWVGTSSVLCKDTYL